MGARRHLVVDDELGEVVAYSVSDVSELLGQTTKTVIARLKPSGDHRPELRGWAPKTEANPNRSWMVDARQIDALAELDVGSLQNQLAELREELETTKARTEADLQQLSVERARAADAVATAEMERSEYRQATLDAANGQIAQLTRERDQARTAVKTLSATVNALAG